VDLKERGKGYCPYMIATVAETSSRQIQSRRLYSCGKGQSRGIIVLQEDFADEKHQTRMD
jgi:hypothetical protein